MSGKRLSKRSDEYKSVFGNAPRHNGANDGGADWGGATSDTLYRLIDTVTSRGGAVRFGYTRDGGAYALGFYYGSEATTEYCRPSEDLEDFLVRWIEFYSELPATGGKSPAQD